jgi:uncharacterized RDD family membrane protein YckC
VPFAFGLPELIILSILVVPVVVAVVLVRRQHGQSIGHEAPGVQFAGIMRRWTAVFIDSLLVGVVVGVFLSMLLATTGIDLFPGAQGLAFLAGALYGAAMESSSSQATLGKLVMRIRVTDTQGQRVTFGKALGRNLSKWVSALTFGIGYLLAAFSKKSQTLHDMMSGCLVTMHPEYRGGPKRSTIGTMMGLLDETGPRS